LDKYLNGKKGNVLIVDDNKDVLQAANLYLKKYLNLVITEMNPQNIPDQLNKNNYDVILLDMNFTQDVSSGKEGFLWLNKILEIDSSAVVILITAYGDVEMAVKAIKAGAVDFVLKPWQNEKLLATIHAGITLRRSKLEAISFKSREKQLAADLDYQYHGIIGKSESIHQVLTSISKLAKTDANILILGESGTGKELVAREIHRQSHRANQVIIAVDMGAITESLFESEFFGHVKGAFTDAKHERAGRFEVSDKGTLFLDEIGNIPPNLQAKLLSAIQNKTITKIGSNKTITVDIRIISATNMDIYGMVEDGSFRQDLLYRINTIEIKLPPLRERLEDIPLLVDHFVAIYSNIHSNCFIRTDFSDCFILYSRKQFGLKIRWYVSNFIKKQGSLIGNLKPARSLMFSISESTFNMSEKLTFE
jgi:DNA-binding NtrC family response regulator